MDFAKRLTVAAISMSLLAWGLLAQTAPKKQTSKSASKGSAKTSAPAHAKSAAPAARSSPAAGAKTATKGSTNAKARTAAASRKSAVKQSPRQYAQMQPAPERYKEIQQALVEKGYFHGTADGAWGADSQDALKRFQADQNLDTDGKLSALSLIALGLGPHRDASLKFSGDGAAQPPLTETPRVPGQTSPPGAEAR